LPPVSFSFGALFPLSSLGCTLFPMGKFSCRWGMACKTTPNDFSQALSSFEDSLPVFTDASPQQRKASPSLRPGVFPARRFISDSIFPVTLCYAVRRVLSTVDRALSFPFRLFVSLDSCFSFRHFLCSLLLLFFSSDRTIFSGSKTTPFLVVRKVPRRGAVFLPPREFPREPSPLLVPLLPGGLPFALSCHCPFHPLPPIC